MANLEVGLRELLISLYRKLSTLEIRRVALKGTRYDRDYERRSAVFRQKITEMLEEIESDLNRLEVLIDSSKKKRSSRSASHSKRQTDTEDIVPIR